MLEHVLLDRRFAGAVRQPESALAEMIDVLLSRPRRGECIDIERETADCSEWSESLRRLWPTLEALAAANSAMRNAGSSAAAGGVWPIQNQNSAHDRNIPNALPLGDFKLLREVGRGGMGIVYEARQVSLDRRVAIKVLPAAGLLDERQLQRFQNEARAAAQLSHPHIVDVICVGCDRGVHYFAMRFIRRSPPRFVFNSSPMLAGLTSGGRIFPDPGVAIEQCGRVAKYFEHTATRTTVVEKDEFERAEWLRWMEAGAAKRTAGGRLLFVKTAMFTKRYHTFSLDIPVRKQRDLISPIRR